VFVVVVIGMWVVLVEVVSCVAMVVINALVLVIGLII